ncbi:acyl-CoA dehydrogenase family protein [Aeromicrobium sp. 179-A 4D2 NHS]|uniref:acyl-CoA dehydrogenase family protein n=1 Tax=Aeromicrobium sp. 179-A 4D2 NHS TaxID=3142375 RepID=UPI0039A0BA41
MKIAFEAEQKDLATSFDQAVASEVDVDALRALWTTETGRSEKLRTTIANLGLTTILVPERFEGYGGTLVDLALVLERVGYHAVPDALVESLVTAPVALTVAGTPEQQAAWLPKLADGSATATVALRGLDSVPDVHVADVLIYLDGCRLKLVETSRCELTALRSMDPSRRQFRVTVPEGAAEDLPNGDPDTVLAHEAAASASVLIGLSRRMLDETVAYVKVREQFGRVIGSFQAVKHQLADAVANVELAAFAVHAAAAKVADGAPDATTAALAARIVAIQAEFEANRASLQLHGGIGFTWEHHLQLWLKRGKALEQAHGGLSELAEALGQATIASARGAA